MELQLKNREISYLEPVILECRNLEQTQEVRLPEGLPDVERVLGCWGQPILRSKEWRTDTVTVSGGLMLRVLYGPEREGAPRMLDSWVPFQAKWELPGDTRDGSILVQPLLRFLDARSLSPRKLLVRCGISLNLLALAPEGLSIPEPETVPEDVQLLKKTVPLRLFDQAGEKSFALEETLSAPGMDLTEQKVFYSTVQPVLTEQKVLGDKIAFRGAVNLHALFCGPEGELEGRDFTFPFSQLAELDRVCGSEAEADIQVCVTNLELEEGGDGSKTVKASFTAQYAVSDVTPLQIVEDGYSTLRPLKLNRQDFPVTALLDHRWETLAGEAALPGEIHSAADLSALWELPVWDPIPQGYSLESSGTVGLLSRQERGVEGFVLHWQGQAKVKTGEDVRLAVTGMSPGALQLNPGAGKITMDFSVHLAMLSKDGLSVVSSMELGEPAAKESDRPSLILRRAGEAGLWELAKASGSTMEAIAQANSLTEEPAKGQMLLIPLS